MPVEDSTGDPNMATCSAPEIILDLSRLLSRVLHATPTGVDRCEMAYARGLLATVPDRLSFAAVHPTGWYGRLRRRAVLEFLDRTEERWNNRSFRSIGEGRRYAVRALLPLVPVPWGSGSGSKRPFYVQASPSNLAKDGLIASVLNRERARFICLVHDLIPIEYPEYAREGGARQHEARIRTVVAHADGIVCNSQSTLNALAPWIQVSGRAPRTAVAHLGTHKLRRYPMAAGAAGSRPYFVCIGTIEPRKNHLLLLNLWRRMSEENGAANIPKLAIVGRRGWENEQIVDMLERCPALRGCVEEHGRLTDHATDTLLAGARALLNPSFAEGYGMPVAEALRHGVPVVCSDLLSLREAGGNVPDYLDPLDGPGWRRAIEDLAACPSALAVAQATRREAWRPSRWDDHVAIVLNMMDELSHE